MARGTAVPGHYGRRPLTGIRVWYREKRGASGYFVLAMVTGLATYAIHGLMNSFLDSDKIAALWWGFIAVIVATELEQRNRCRRGEEDAGMIRP